MAAAVPISSSATWLRAVVQLFESQGVDPKALLAEAGLDPARLDDPHERFATADISCVWEIGVRISGQPALGLDRQLAKRYMKLDIATQAMWSGPTLRDGLEGLSKYLLLIGDSAAFEVKPERGDAWLELVHGAIPGVPRQRVEFGLLAMLMVCQQVTRRALRPQEIEIFYPEPVDFHPYRMAFHCPLRFGQPATRMKLGRAELQMPIVRPVDSVTALHERVIEERLARFGQARTTYRASEEIIRRLHQGEPQRQDIARSLGLSEAAFDKQLKAEGNPYPELLDGVRKELAAHYLAQHGLALPRISGLLGWELPAQFTEACKRWFGLGPLQYRQRLAAGLPAS